MYATLVRNAMPLSKTTERTTYSEAEVDPVSGRADMVVPAARTTPRPESPSTLPPPEPPPLTGGCGVVGLATGKHRLPLATLIPVVDELLLLEFPDETLPTDVLPLLDALPLLELWLLVTATLTLLLLFTEQLTELLLVIVFVEPVPLPLVIVWAEAEPDNSKTPVIAVRNAFINFFMAVSLL